jgi:hypothetical protein
MSLAVMEKVPQNTHWITAALFTVKVLGGKAQALLFQQRTQS